MEETLLDPLYEASITLIPKPDKDVTQKKENYRPVSLIILDAKILSMLKGSYTMIKGDLSQ